MGILSTSRRIANRLLDPLGFEIVRRSSTYRDSYPVSSIILQEQIDQCQVMAQPIAEFFDPSFPAHDTRRLVRDFFSLYFASSLRPDSGSSGLNSMLALYLAARVKEPDVIIESGTFQGFGSWALRQACPNAQIHCFDLDFRNLIYRDPSIHYHKHDWMDGAQDLKLSDNSLGFFDDHVNQGQRILEAAERGLKWLIFDDDVSWYTLHRDGLPPVPTVSMLFDETLPAGQELEWVSAKRHMTYICDGAFNAKARAVVRQMHRIAEIYDQTGYASTPMALVRLV